MTAVESRGRHAEDPRQVPTTGWKDVLLRAKEETKADNVPLLAGGVAFFALLALVPGLVALVSIYGLFADPAAVERQVRDLLGAAPREVRQLIQTQLRSIVDGSSTGIGIGAVIGILVALWSASSGMKHLVSAINAAYDEDETRKFLKLRAISLLLTVGAVIFLAVAFAIVALLPALLAGTPLGDTSRIVIGILRWPVLGLGMIVGLSVLYRYGPDRDDAQWRWVSPGAIVAMVLWVAASVGFSVYAANFGKFNETYGSLGAVVVVMLWLFLTAYVVIAGAEINAELERQTVQDTTEGQKQPLGYREAHAADTVGPSAEEIKGGQPPDVDLSTRRAVAEGPPAPDDGWRRKLGQRL